MIAKEENKMNTTIQAEYEKSLNDHYLVLKNEQWEENDYQLSMIIENQIPYFLPLEIRSIDGRNDLYYKISSLQPIAKLFKNREMKLEDVKAVLVGLTKAFLTAQEYMLEEKHIVIEPEYIFMNTKNRQIHVLFDPYFEKEAEDSLKELADYLIVKIDHSDQNAVMMGYQFYRTVREDNFVINDIVRLYMEHPAKVQGDMADNEEMMQSRESYSIKNTGDGGSSFDIKHQEGQEYHNYQYYDRNKKTKDSLKEDFNTKSSINQMNDRNDSWVDRGIDNRMVQNKNSKKTIPLLIKRIISVVLAVISGILLFGGIGSYHPDHMEKVIWGIIFLVSGLSTGIDIFQIVFKKSEAEAVTDSVNYENIFSDMPKKINLTDTDVRQQERHLWQDSQFPGSDLEEDIRENIQADILEEPSKDIQNEEIYGKTVILTSDGQMAENILVETKKGKETRHFIESFPYTIGKVKDNVDLALNDISVSRVHARIIEENGRIYVQDCNSTNGTYVNGILLDKEEKIPIEKDDEIGIGRVVLLYQ